jgi:hypothetical protein
MIVLFVFVMKVAVDRIYVRSCGWSEGTKQCKSWDPEQVETLELSQGQSS